MSISCSEPASITADKQNHAQAAFPFSFRKGTQENGDGAAGARAAFS
jgi:hypothetical protein